MSTVSGRMESMPQFGQRAVSPLSVHSFIADTGKVLIQEKHPHKWTLFSILRFRSESLWSIMQPSVEGESRSYPQAMLGMLAILDHES